jgi:energy-coupling factor transporter ATP-binding protein EcfA2
MTTEQLATINQDHLAQVHAFVMRQHDVYKNVEATAKKIGLSSRASVYNFINQKWSEISLDAFNKMASKAGAGEVWRVAETNTYESMLGAFNVTLQMKSMYAAIGDTGAGKSFCSKHLAKKFGATYIECDGTWSRGEFINQLLAASGQSARRAGESLAASMRRLCVGLSNNGCPLVVIDESSTLRLNVLQLLHGMYNQVKGTVGILLIGTEALKLNILRGAQYNRNNMQELYGRIGHWQILDPIDYSDVNAMCEENGIVEQSAKTWLFNCSKSLHTIANMIQKAKAFAAKMGVDTITGDFLGQMNGGMEWNEEQFLNMAERLQRAAKK